MNVVLNLPIKGKWFDMIAYGGKREEYRDCEHRQVQRAYLWAANDQWWGLTKPVAIFRNGYSMKSRAMVVDIVGFDLRGRWDVKHPEWGEPRRRRSHIVVKLGQLVGVGTYGELKRMIAERNGKRAGKESEVKNG